MASDSQTPPSPNTPDNFNNIVGTLLYPGTDLALSQTLTAGATTTGPAINTIYGATIVVLSKLASGSGYLACDVEATAAAMNLNTPTVGTGDAPVNGTGFTLTLSGTGLQSAIAQTSTASPFFQLAQICVGNMGFTRLDTFVIYELQMGQDWFSATSGALNAVGTSINGAPNTEGTVGCGNIHSVLKW